MAGPSYEYIYADVERKKRVNDGGVWNKSGFTQAIEKNQLYLLTRRCFP